MRIVILILCGIVILLPSSFEFGGGDDGGKRGGPDVVSKAFDEYEQLWRQVAAKGAEQLEAGALATDEAATAFLGESSKAARVTAFQAIADAEEAAYWSIDESGERVRAEWTPAKHAEILREYVR